jgi:hypothetical protein
MKNEELRALINEVSLHLMRPTMRAMMTPDPDSEDFKHFSNGWLMGLMTLRDALDERDKDYHWPTREEGRRAVHV